MVVMQKLTMAEKGFTQPSFQVLPVIFRIQNPDVVLPFIMPPPQS